MQKLEFNGVPSFKIWQIYKITILSSWTKVPHIQKINFELRFLEVENNWKLKPGKLYHKPF